MLFYSGTCEILLRRRVTDDRFGLSFDITSLYPLFRARVTIRKYTRGVKIAQAQSAVSP